MDMTADHLSDSDRYGDEVLNANWLPHPALALGLQTAAEAVTRATPTLTDIDGFMARLYCAQE